LRIPEGVTLRIKASLLDRFNAKIMANYKTKRCKAMVRRCKTLMAKCGNCGREFQGKEKECPQCQTERNCNYKFKKGESKCPICGADRTQCNNKTNKGSEYCTAHNKINRQDLFSLQQKDLEQYDPTKTDRKSVSIGTVMDLDYELQKYQSMMSNLEQMVDKSDPKELSRYILQLNKYWKDVIATYYQIIDRKQVIEKIPADIENKIKEIMIGTDKKVTIACIEAFINAMMQNNIEDKMVNKIIDSLPQEMKDVYNRRNDNVEIINGQ